MLLLLLLLLLLSHRKDFAKRSENWGCGPVRGRRSTRGRAAGSPRARIAGCFMAARIQWNSCLRAQNRTCKVSREGVNVTRKVMTENYILQSMSSISSFVSCCALVVRAARSAIGREDLSASKSEQVVVWEQKPTVACIGRRLPWDEWIPLKCQDWFLHSETSVERGLWPIPPAGDLRGQLGWDDKRIGMKPEPLSHGYGRATADLPCCILWGFPRRYSANWRGTQ